MPGRSTQAAQAIRIDIRRVRARAGIVLELAVEHHVTEKLPQGRQQTRLRACGINRPPRRTPESLAHISHQTRTPALWTLLVEQRLVIALRISHRVYVMGHGRVVFEGTPAALMANEAVRREWLEV